MFSVDAHERKGSSDTWKALFIPRCIGRLNRSFMNIADMTCTLVLATERLLPCIHWVNDSTKEEDKTK